MFFYRIPSSLFWFLKYAIVWIVGTSIDVGILYILAVVFDILYIISTVIAFIFAATNNFLLNKIWTFGDKNAWYKRQYIKFLTVSVIWLGLTLLCMGFLVEIIHLPIILSKLLTSGIVLLWNFLANKYWTFAGRFSLKYSITHASYRYELSIIIPAYNESNRIKNTLDQINMWRNNPCNYISVEVLVINDGSTDDTEKIVQEYIKNNNYIRLINLPDNVWKWWAVACWVNYAQWRYSLIFDADASTPVTQIDKILPYRTKYDLVIGSRYLVTSNVEKKQSWLRRFISRFGNFLIQTILIDWIQDTQCGFKMFDTDKWRAIFWLQKIQRWWFDIEMLFLARAFQFTIYEVWVEWNNDVDSKFRAIRDSWRTFYELLVIKFSAWFGGYNK